MAELTIIEAIRAAIQGEMERDERVMVLGLDVGRLGGVFRTTDGMIEKFGRSRVFDTPLAEAEGHHRQHLLTSQRTTDRHRMAAHRTRTTCRAGGRACPAALAGARAFAQAGRDRLRRVQLHPVQPALGAGASALAATGDSRQRRGPDAREGRVATVAGRVDGWNGALWRGHARRLVAREGIRQRRLTGVDGDRGRETEGELVWLGTRAGLRQDCRSRLAREQGHVRPPGRRPRGDG